MNCRVADGDVVATDDDGLVRWRGRPLGYSVKAVSPIDATGAAVVLLDYVRGPTKFANLIRIRSDGSIVWQAPLPDVAGNDSFVEFRWDCGRLVAHTWSGYQMVISVDDGSVASAEFVK
jgi:hypothetical protein